MQKGFIIRFILGLAIAAPMVFHLATADIIEHHQQMPVHGGQEIAISALTPFVLPVSMQTEPNKGNTALEEAFQTRPTELLCAKTLSLEHRGEETLANVSVAADAIDLTILHPNETFSFNDIVGIRSEEKGYKPGLMYANGEVITGIGGGICIVSTVIYNAVLETGLKIIERHPHSGPVSYADPGRDAAVSYGWADLRFKNDTNDPIYIRTKVENNELVVSLYGTKNPDRTVEISSEDYEEIPYKIIEKEDASIPESEVKVTQKARAGFRVTTARIIKENGKVVSQEVISQDTVLPRNKVILVPVKSTPMPNILPLPDFPNIPIDNTIAPKTGTFQIPDSETPQTIP